MSVGVVNKQTGDRIPTAGMPAIDTRTDVSVQKQRLLGPLYGNVQRTCTER